MVGNKEKIVTYLINQEPTKEFEIKEYKPKRSRNQNSYYYELLNQLARKMKIPSEELHFEMIRKSNPFTDILIPEEADIRALKYYEKLSSIIKNEKVFISYRVWVPSHELDTVEMGILLDSLIEECKRQGIETMTPDELARLRGITDEN